jgi:hypothetical protein
MASHQKSTLSPLPGFSNGKTEPGDDTRKREEMHAGCILNTKKVKRQHYSPAAGHTPEI